MTVSFINSPIFTRHFSPEDYGNYTLVFITFYYLSIITLTWISSCFWRFYPKYQNTDKIRSLYSSIFYLIIASLFIILLFTIVLYFEYSNVQIKKLVLFSFLTIVSAEMLNIINIPLRYEGKVKLYNVINIIKTLAGFSILLVLTFVFNQGIESFLISTSVVNFLLLGIILSIGYGKDWLKPLKPDFEIIKEVFNYGKSGMFANIGLLILINSDRYIIGLFYDKNSVGIYNQLYNIAQLSVAAIINVFFATINPVFLNTLENNKKELISVTARYYVLFSVIVVPFTVYFSLYANEICHIMLGERFRLGQQFLPAIMFSSLLYGYTLFHEARLKFDNKIGRVVQGMLFAGMLNIILNFIFLPNSNYFYATLTTLASYLLLFIYVYLNDNFRMKVLLSYSAIFAKIGIILAFETLIHFSLKWIIGWNEFYIAFSIAEGFAFLIIYFIVIYSSRSYKLLMKNMEL